VTLRTLFVVCSLMSTNKSSRGAENH